MEALGEGLSVSVGDELENDKKMKERRAEVPFYI